MKRFGLALFLGFSVMAEPVQHAVLTPDLQLIDHYEMIDPGLVAQYRADPSKAAKVGRYRLLVVPAKPSATLQQTVEPAGTNINDGGYTLTATEVTQVWNLRSLTGPEIAQKNAATAIQVSEVLDDIVRTNNWEQRHLRALYLESEATYFLVTALVRANMHTNLTVPERQRFNTVSNELRELWTMWKYGKTNYEFVRTNLLVVNLPTNWPPLSIEE